MLISKILSALPASLEWMVLFKFSAIRTLTDDATVRQMFFLQSDLDLELYSHVILTSNGGFLAPHEGVELINSSTNRSYIITGKNTSLGERFSSQLSLFPVDEADCFGIGKTDPFPPVLLYLRIKSGYGEAKAVFSQEPSQAHYELLQAIGVKFLGGYQQNSDYIAQFRNRLPVHIHAGTLAHFTRTGNCNLFFLYHGNIDSQLEAGLIQASESRVNWAKNLCIEVALQLGHAACRQSMAMKCQPPLSAKSFPYGDIVPLGFILKALNVATSNVSILAIRQELSNFLLNKRQDNLWSFHTDTLITSTDSVLVLQGLNEPEAVEALEIFADNGGNYHSHAPRTYYPQICSDEQQPGIMVVNDRNRHWCQSDYATTCLVRALRRQAGLATTTTVDDYVTAGFNSRSGLFFANPYMVDWALASALSADESVEELRDKLIAEILASMNDDYSFGIYDIPMSTSFAILSLTALGCRSRIIRLAQIRLLDFIDSEGKLPQATPFYSTLLIEHQKISHQQLFKLSLSDYRKQIIQLNNQYYGISFYDDSYSMITTSVAALALAEKCDPTNTHLNLAKMRLDNSHPRYQCRSHSEYIVKFALPPYFLSDVHESCFAKII